MRGSGTTSPRAPATVAVIGAGFTGLAAAYDLARAGVTVEVFEASTSIGGLAAGFTLQDGFHLERAYHFLYTTDHHMTDLVDELNLRDRLHFHPSEIRVVVNAVAYPFTSAIDLLRFTPLRFRDRLRTGVTALRLRTVRDWQPLTEVTAYEWLRRVNGERATDILWRPLLEGKFGSAWDTVTMAWLWTRIAVRQRSRQRGDNRERLGYFDGGFAVVVDRLREELEAHNASVRSGTKVDQMGSAGGSPVLVVDGTPRDFDAVLVTTPSPVFAAVARDHPQMTDDYARMLRSVQYLDAIVVILSTTEPLTDTYWHQIQDTGSPFLVVVSLDSLVGTSATGGRHITYLGAYVPDGDHQMALSDDELRERWFTELARLFPRFGTSTIRESHVFRFRNAQHVVGVDFASRIPVCQTPLEGYYLANFAQVFPEDRGTNYAVRDGRAAAALILQHLTEREAPRSRPLPPAHPEPRP